MFYRGFSGCVGSFKWDRKALPLIDSPKDSSSLISISSSNGVSSGCSLRILCSQLPSNYCPSVLQCLDSWKGPICTCAPSTNVLLNENGEVSLRPLNTYNSYLSTGHWMWGKISSIITWYFFPSHYPYPRIARCTHSSSSYRSLLKVSLPSPSPSLPPRFSLVIQLFSRRRSTLFDTVRPDEMDRDNARQYSVEGGGQSDNDQVPPPFPPPSLYLSINYSIRSIIFVSQ